MKDMYVCDTFKVQLYFGIYDSLMHILNIEIKETIWWINAVLYNTR